MAMSNFGEVFHKWNTLSSISFPEVKIAAHSAIRLSQGKIWGHADIVEPDSQVSRSNFNENRKCILDFIRYMGHFKLAELSSNAVMWKFRNEGVIQVV
ncbi:hypothetical protein AVEN_186239-1 [Araneus ventricosus]|uniref:Uncharacterized protein n=1 Tax=Araneus ventricosus TaxID=182803 RepID=A0A4Y2L056_ARAVE|nr:hypothetical protein AVEN_186239-1 [Araneus ventricosus]